MTNDPPSSSELLVRSAVAADVPTIARFNVALADETEGLTLDPPTVRAGVQAVIDDSSKGVYWIAEVDSAVVGQLMLTYEWSDWRNGLLWWIQSVYVDPAHRGCGFFTALFQSVLARAESDSEVCGLRLHVAHDNAAAQATYSRLGMRQIEYQVFECFTGSDV